MITSKILQFLPCPNHLYIAPPITLNDLSILLFEYAFLFEKPVRLRKLFSGFFSWDFWAILYFYFLPECIFKYYFHLSTCFIYAFSIVIFVYFFFPFWQICEEDVFFMNLWFYWIYLFFYFSSYIFIVLLIYKFLYSSFFSEILFSFCRSFSLIFNTFCKWCPFNVGAVLSYTWFWFCISDNYIFDNLLLEFSRE